jgi:hypothetical protein
VERPRFWILPAPEIIAGLIFTPAGGRKHLNVIGLALARRSVRTAPRDLSDPELSWFRPLSPAAILQNHLQHT